MLRSLVEFKLGDSYYAVDISQIKGVVPCGGIAKLPNTPSYIKGITNIRGSVTMVFDLCDKFKLSCNDGDEKFIVILEAGTENIGVMIPTVPKTLSVDDSKIDSEKSVTPFMGSSDDYIDGIIRADNRMIVLIDLFRLTNINVVKN
jgi:purine-binding chemotaxis protein CheW